MTEVCQDCGRPFTDSGFVWQDGYHCGRQLPRTENNDSSELAAECAEHTVERLRSDLAATKAKLAAWEALAEFIADGPDNGVLSADYVDETGCILERIGQPDVKAGGSTYTEAARNLAAKLGLIT